MKTNKISTRTKRYFTPLYETVTENGVTKKLHYLTSSTGLFAIFASYNNGGGTMHYTLKDHQGNLTATVCGNTVERLSYDAWGRRRNPVGFGYSNVTHTFDRGYTGHEHLTAFGLINMNGRMYDPMMSSFLSVDRYVHQPENSQGFNRYAYCMYNPLKYVDPSGWRLSLPNGHGVTPPPDGDEVGNYITGVYTDTGFNNEYDCYTYSYGLNEVTVTAYSWAMEECRRLGEQNCGGLSAEYSGGEVNVPTISAGGGGGGGAFCQNDNNNSTTNNVNIEILGDVINTTGLYTYMEKVFAYSETLGKWTDKMGNRRPLTDNGNQYTGGKLKYGKYMSKRFMKASTALNTIGVGLSVVEMAATPNTDDKIKYGADIVFGVIGFAPGGVFISTFWFLGGRELVFQYGYTMGELMKDGINPGMPAYQPFK